MDAADGYDGESHSQRVFHNPYLEEIFEKPSTKKEKKKNSLDDDGFYDLLDKEE